MRSARVQAAAAGFFVFRDVAVLNHQVLRIPNDSFNVSR